MPKYRKRALVVSARLTILALLLAALWVLGACENMPEVEAPAEEDVALEEVAVPAVEDWTQHFVAEGQYIYVGNPEAAVTILDVSDFL